MSEFPDPCPAGGVYADRTAGEWVCPTCGRSVIVSGGRWSDHTRGPRDGYAVQYKPTLLLDLGHGQPVRIEADGG